MLSGLGCWLAYPALVVGFDEFGHGDEALGHLELPPIPRQLQDAPTGHTCDRATQRGERTGRVVMRGGAEGREQTVKGGATRNGLVKKWPSLGLGLGCRGGVRGQGWASSRTDLVICRRERVVR